MIKISDYKLIEFSDSNQKNNKLKRFQKSIHFKYLYPIQKQLQQGNYKNQLKQIINVKFLQTFQECEQIKDLVEMNIFSTSQKIYLMKHKNPGSQKLYISINIISKNLTLKKVIELYFIEKLFIPSELFCTFFIEKMIQFYQILQKVGIKLKIITPDDIHINEDNIFLNYSKVVQLIIQKNLINQISKNQEFCSPQLLKYKQNQTQKFNNCKQIMKMETINKQNKQHSQNKIYYDNYPSEKQFDKSILYSIGLCILNCFKYKISIQDRYEALKNTKQLNNFIKGLRKEIKIFHQGKYISKLLKLMFEHSQTLRDNVQTFKIKMNSQQFNFLKKKQVKIDKRPQTIKTESQIQQNGFILSGRKTIDINISMHSNNSSINKSWLSISHLNNDKSPSPIQLSAAFTQQKNINSISKSKQSLPMNQLNEVINQETQQMCDSQKSVVNIQIDWDEDLSIHQQISSIPSRNNKNSEKDKLKFSINTIEEQELSQQINDQIDLIQKNKIIKKKSQQNNLLSKTQKCKDIQLSPQKQKTKNKISQTQNCKPILSASLLKQKQKQKVLKKMNLKKQQINNISKEQNHRIIRNQKGQLQRFDKNLIKLIDKNSLKNNQGEIQLNQHINLKKKQSQQLILQSMSIDSVYHKNDLNSESNFSTLIGQNSFYELNQQNKSFFKQKKQNKQMHKYLLKKDKYNSRSRIIIITLFIIYLIYQFINWFITRKQNKNYTQ